MDVESQEVSQISSRILQSGRMLTFSYHTYLMGQVGTWHGRSSSLSRTKYSNCPRDHGSVSDTRASGT
jgi:hypothetical protein